MRFPHSITCDFLDTGLVIALSKSPALLREQLRLPVILDEVQEVPAVLDEVHVLIESHGLRFILCGSSVRCGWRSRAWSFLH